MFNAIFELMEIVCSPHSPPTQYLYNNMRLINTATFSVIDIARSSHCMNRLSVASASFVKGQVLNLVYTKL